MSERTCKHCGKPIVRDTAGRGWRHGDAIGDYTCHRITYAEPAETAEPPREKGWLKPILDDVRADINARPDWQKNRVVPAEPAPPAAPQDEAWRWSAKCAELEDELARLEAEIAQLRQLLQDQAWPEPLKPGERQKLEAEIAALRNGNEVLRSAIVRMKNADYWSVMRDIADVALANSNTQKSGRDPVESSHGE